MDCEALNNGTSSSSNPASLGTTSATTNATDLVIGIANTINTVQPGVTVGTGFSNLRQKSYAFSVPSIWVNIEDKEVSSTGAQNATMGNPNTTGLSGSTVAFKEIASSVIITDGGGYFWERMVDDDSRLRALLKRETRMCRKTLRNMRQGWMHMRDGYNKYPRSTGWYRRQQMRN